MEGLVYFVIVGFVVMQIPKKDHQILCNYRKSYHYHLSKKSPHFSDGGGPPQGRLPQWPQGFKVESLISNPTTPSLDHLSQILGHRKKRYGYCINTDLEKEQFIAYIMWFPSRNIQYKPLQDTKQKNCCGCYEIAAIDSSTTTKDRL